MFLHSVGFVVGQGGDDVLPRPSSVDEDWHEHMNAVDVVGSVVGQGGDDVAPPPDYVTEFDYMFWHEEMLLHEKAGVQFEVGVQETASAGDQVDNTDGHATGMCQPQGDPALDMGVQSVADATGQVGSKGDGHATGGPGICESTNCGTALVRHGEGIVTGLQLCGGICNEDKGHQRVCRCKKNHQMEDTIQEDTMGVKSPQTLHEKPPDPKEGMHEEPPLDPPLCAHKKGQRKRYKTEHGWRSVSPTVTISPRMPGDGEHDDESTTTTSSSNKSRSLSSLTPPDAAFCSAVIARSKRGEPVRDPDEQGGDSVHVTSKGHQAASSRHQDMRPNEVVWGQPGWLSAIIETTHGEQRGPVPLKLTAHILDEVLQLHCRLKSDEINSQEFTRGLQRLRKRNHIVWPGATQVPLCGADARLWNDLGDMVTKPPSWLVISHHTKLGVNDKAPPHIINTPPHSTNTHIIPPLIMALVCLSVPMWMSMAFFAYLSFYVSLYNFV